MSFRSLHFRCPDPLSREASSRATRYRVKKRRRCENEEGIDGTKSRALDDDVDNDDASHEILDYALDDATPRRVLPTSEMLDSTDDDDDEFECLFSNDLDDLLPPENHVVHDLVSESSRDQSYTVDDEINNADLPNESNCDLVSSCSLLVKQYSMRHGLTQEAVTDLLHLLQLYLPDPGILPSSLYLFEKQFRSLKYPVKFHYMCSYCSQCLPNDKVVHCPNQLCRKALKTVGEISSFIELPIDQQLINLLQRKSLHAIIMINLLIISGEFLCLGPECWYEICKSFEDRTSFGDRSHRRDVYGGVVYRQLIESGFLSSSSNISLLCNTDGIPVFRSSSFSIWPLLLLVNELPFSMR